MAHFKDQLGRTITISSPPERIISVVPSQTELLYDLRLENEVVGITKFCVHPKEWFNYKAKVGGTKKLHIDVIRSLHPDLIIANKEENDKEQLEELMKDFPVWISDIYTLQNALSMIHSIGEITGKVKQSEAIANNIQNKFDQLTPNPSLETRPAETSNQKPEAAYFIWRNPWMVAGKETFIHEMMNYCGFDNCFSHLSRYPEIQLAQLNKSGCKWILLSSEPFPFREKHAEEIRQIIPDAKIIFVDGEMFSWYGSRLLKAPEYFKEIREKITE